MHLKIVQIHKTFTKTWQQISCTRFSCIVNFLCDNCKPDPSKCCVGTMIAPNYAISTTFCASSCRFILERNKIIPITNTHSYPGNRNYLNIRRDRHNKLNDIALIVFKSEAIVNNNRSYVKLSAVEPPTLIGVKALIPEIDGNKLRLKASVIIPCDEPYIKLQGYYVCSSKDLMERSIYRHRHGIPLLVNNSILGISGNNDEQLSQKIFIAVEPFLSWINTKVQKSDSRQQQKLILRNEANWARNTFSSPESDIIIKDNTNTRNITKIKKPAAVEDRESKIENENNVKTKVTIVDNTFPAADNDLDPLRKPTGFNYTDDLTNDFQKTYAHNILETATVVTIEDDKAKIPTFLINSTTIAKILDNEKTTIFVIEFDNNTKLPLHTNAMQWFQKIKTFHDDPQSMFLLTSTPSYYIVKNTTKFIDLT